MQTHLGQSSCLATLKFHNALTALTMCDTEQITLPSPEKAVNLGYGIWLITSASDAFRLKEFSSGKDSVSLAKDHPGCNVCIITLEWKPADKQEHKDSPRSPDLQQNSNKTNQGPTTGPTRVLDISNATCRSATLLRDQSTSKCSDDEKCQTRTGPKPPSRGEVESTS